MLLTGLKFDLGRQFCQQRGSRMGGAGRDTGEWSGVPRARSLARLEGTAGPKVSARRPAMPWRGRPARERGTRAQVPPAATAGS